MDKTSNDPAASTTDLSELFPMRMTSIEKLHWFDGDSDLPNLVFCRLRFNEKLDEQLARHAWKTVVSRQPFADVKPAKIKGHWHWVLGPRGNEEGRSTFESWNGTRFEWNEYTSRPSPWRLDNHPIREKTGSYLGVSVWPNEDCRKGGPVPEYVSEVWSYAHHAIGDGPAAIMVVSEWMAVYDNLVNGKDPETGLHRLEPGLLSRRNRLGVLSWRYLKHLPKQPVALFGAAKFVLRKTAELMPEKDRMEPEVYPAICGDWIHESQVVKILESAKSHNVMLNSLLLGQLYLTLTEWRSRAGVHDDHDWIRVILPMSIRNISDRRLPFANRATIVQIDRCGKEMHDLQQFYRSLDREIRIIRGWQLDKMFLLAIRSLAVFEPWLKRAAQNDKSRGMAVFTNLGEPLRNLERTRSRRPDVKRPILPEAFDFVGPVRVGTPVNFSVARFRGKMRVALHFDNQVLSFSQAEELLQSFIGRLNDIKANATS